jgi:hypothetical protein
MSKAPMSAISSALLPSKEIASVGLKPNEY